MKLLVHSFPGSATQILADKHIQGDKRPQWLPDTLAAHLDSWRKLPDNVDGTMTVETVPSNSIHYLRTHIKIRANQRTATGNRNSVVAIFTWSNGGEANNCKQSNEHFRYQQRDNYPSSLAIEQWIINKTTLFIYDRTARVMTSWNHFSLALGNKFFFPLEIGYFSDWIFNFQIVDCLGIFFLSIENFKATSWVRANDWTGKKEVSQWQHLGVFISTIIQQLGVRGPRCSAISSQWDVVLACHGECYRGRTLCLV